MDKLIEQVHLAVTKQQKQELSAQIMSVMPQFMKELGALEQNYWRGYHKCVDAEGSKAAGEILMNESDTYKDYKYKKRLYEAIESTIKVLSMYT